MKRLITGLCTFVSAVALSAFIGGCASHATYILPTAKVAGTSEITVELLNNIEETTVLYESGDNIHILDHEQFTEISSIQYTYVLKHNNSIIGWFDFGGAYWIDNNDKTKYEYGIPSNTDNTFSDVTLYLYLIGGEEDFFRNNVSFSSNYGTFTLTSVFVPSETGDDVLAVANYSFDLSGINAKSVTDMEITITFTE